MRHLAHDGGRADRKTRLARAVVERQLEIVLAEERFELLRAHGAEREELIVLRVVVEQERFRIGVDGIAMMALKVPYGFPVIIINPKPTIKGEL